MTRRRMLSLAAMPATIAAQDILELPPPQPDRVVRYGADPSQFTHLWLPKASGPHPSVIVIHGGFWRARYDLWHISHLCQALRDAGIAACSLEYRRIGNGGGWPVTFDDVAAAATHLFANAAQWNLDARRIAVTGHSAGGHLALLLGTTETRLRGAVSLAGVADLRMAYDRKLSNQVVGELMGGSPGEKPDAYRVASPVERLPQSPSRTVLLHGADDNIVPLAIAQSYAARNKAARLEILPGTGHFELIDPRTKAFSSVLRALRELLG